MFLPHFVATLQPTGDDAEEKDRRIGRDGMGGQERGTQ